MDNPIENEKISETETKDDQNDYSAYYSCKYCSKKYKLLARLQTHENVCSQSKFDISLQANHKLDDLKPNNEDKSCNICGQAFKYMKRLRKHELKHKMDQQFWCKYCRKHFTTKTEIEIHKANEHSDKMKKRKCKLCLDLIFETEEEYFVHVNEEHKGKYGDYHMCSDCGKQFKTKNELTHHNKSHCGTIKQYKCKVCGQDLMTAGSLYNHMLRHTIKCSNMCGYCGKMFLTIGQLKVHERTHTQEKAFVCNVCHKGFCHRQSLITHSSLHTGVKPYQCENCGNSFSCVGNLIKHRRTHADTCGSIPLTNHRVNNPSTKMKVKINTPLTSKIKSIKKEKEILEKLTIYKNKLKEKNGSVENLNREQNDCETYEQELVQSDGMDIEQGLEDGPEYITNGYVSDQNYYNGNMDEVTKNGDLDEHKPETQTVVKIKKSRKFSKLEQNKISENELHEFMKTRGFLDEISEGACQYCNKLYTNVRWLFQHEKQHQRLQSNANKCSCCKASFHSREACRAHQRNVHADILGCQDCDKLFSNVDSLRSHTRIFHKGLPKKVYVYVCEKCGVQFRQKALLHHHERNNCETEPMYECHICSKKFHSIHTRRSHLRIHDPKKKFLCKFCGKSFRWKGQLKVHERSHTGEKPFKCLYCPKAFGYRESLITHSSLHTGIKPHLCQACGSRFSCIGNLIKHRTTHASTCGLWYSKNQ